MLDPISVQIKSEKELMDILSKIERGLSCTFNGQLVENLMREKEYIVAELSERQFIEAFKASNRPSSQNLTDDELSQSEELEEHKKREASIKKKKP